MKFLGKFAFAALLSVCFLTAGSAQTTQAAATGELGLLITSMIATSRLDQDHDRSAG